MSEPMGRALEPGQRRMSIVAYLGLVVVYVLILQGTGLLLTRGRDDDYATFTTVEQLVRGLLVSVVLALILVWGAVAVLRWWRPVVVEELRVQRWVWFVPIVMVATILAMTNYAGLLDKDLGFVLLFAVAMLCVGFGEEGMFRGLGVTVFRQNGFSEGKVALWTCVIFGAAHSSNLVIEGPKAFVQVLVTIAAGYLLYLARRVSGGIVVPALLHAGWDFALTSGRVEEGTTYALGILAILADLVMITVVFLRRRRIELPESAPA